MSPRSAAKPRPFSLVRGLLRPALECLQRELGAQYSIGDLQRSLRVRDRDLDLLLGATQDDGRTRVARRFCQPRAGVRRAPRLRGRRAADSRQEHRRVSHGPGRTAAHRCRSAHAYAPAAARVDPAAPADDDREPVRCRRTARRDSVQGAVGADHARGAADARRARAVQVAGRAGFRPAAGPSGRAARAPRRLHPHECVRPGDRVC